MRRSLLIRVMLTAVVVGAAFPTIVAAVAGQPVDPQLIDPTTAQKTAGTVPPPLPDTIVGQLVDSACYMTRGAAFAMAPEHLKCATMCAQKGGRLAVVTVVGAVFAVTGVLTQDNNAKLIPLLQRTVVLTGTISAVRSATIPPPIDVTTDGRRPSGNEAGIIAKRLTKTADFREGDLFDGVELSIDAVTADLAPIRLQ